MAAQLLHLAGRLRAAGLFTIVAVTKPFAFEGPRKMEAATFLISQLAEATHLIAVVEQVHSCVRIMSAYVLQRSSPVDRA